MTQMCSDPGEVERAVALFFVRGTVVELRAPESRQGTLSGYFDDPRALVREATRLSGSVPGVYVTLNPVNRELLARARNRVRSFAKGTTSDADIVRRRWLPIDLDPIRPAGISSTETQHAAAIEAGHATVAWLRERGFSGESLVLADSGNGAHVLVRIELPNDAAALALVRRCVEAVGLYCGTDTVAVDPTVYNAARIWKLYGTVAAKGDAMSDRPHRLARILEGADMVPAAATLLEQLAALRPVGSRPGGGGTRAAESFDVRAWLARHDVTIRREKPWIAGATVLELGACPFNPTHARGEAAVILCVNGMLLFTCQHQSCAGKEWRDVRAHFDGAPTQRAARRVAVPAPPHAAMAEEPESDEVRLVSLGSIAPASVRWLWQGRIPLGAVTLLVGDGGLGKSTLALELAARLTHGQLGKLCTGGRAGADG
jgi:AAA domain